ncbi:hypothetical protein TERTU_2915 [Teredinibacter turnerae T7901]|uniref:Uncharacterized protein n=1 Tax=Teredinibacter turnerae (strain ATCC 39867 / T7901) TaxID=377629 RepID=C5BNC7_TERTT|nr:hypothetical protein TERTU_2915 [Teredinibacter turnerae T7901]
MKFSFGIFQNTRTKLPTSSHISKKHFLLILQLSRMFTSKK